MPWCEPCAKFWTPSSMHADGSCPTCGTTIADVAAEQRAPWHFKLLVAGVCIYLAWRLIQGIAWLVR